MFANTVEYFKNIKKQFAKHLAKGQIEFGQLIYKFIKNI